MKPAPVFILFPEPALAAPFVPFEVGEPMVGLAKLEPAVELGAEPKVPVAGADEADVPTEPPVELGAELVVVPTLPAGVVPTELDPADDGAPEPRACPKLCEAGSNTIRAATNESEYFISCLLF